LFLSEIHIIKKSNKNYKEIKELSSLFGEIYNKINYQIRQDFFNEKPFKSKFDWFKEIPNNKKIFYLKKPIRLYRGLVDSIINNYISFFKASKDYIKNPYKYKSQPRPPRYKKGKDRFYLVRFSDNAILKRNISKGLLGLSSTNIIFKTKLTKEDSIKEVKLIPKNGYFIISVSYEKIEKIPKLNINYCSIDLGVNNLMTITSNKNLKPVIVNGRPLKSINQIL
jgi:putative transposase